MNSVLEETKNLIGDGLLFISMPEVVKKLSGLGYCFDRALDCNSVARRMTGPRAGQSYPVKTLYIKHKATGLSWASVDIVRDENWQKVKSFRKNYFSSNKARVIEF